MLMSGRTGSDPRQNETRNQRLTIRFQKLSAASIFLKFRYLYWFVTALVAACSDVTVGSASRCAHPVDLPENYAR